MNFIPCRERVFPYRLNAADLYPLYLKWLKHLGERLGAPSTLSMWRNTFKAYDERLLIQILSSAWQEDQSAEGNTEDRIHAALKEFLAETHLDWAENEIGDILEHTPPIYQIQRFFGGKTMEKDISAYDALHLRFDGFAHLAETIIQTYKKQGELIVYDLMIESRLAANHGKTCTVEEFITDFTAEGTERNLFTAGLKFEVIQKTTRVATLHVRECEWARYFQERHPGVGYLMACSTDEVSYKACNPSLRMQRTQTLMEGGEMCDFKIYSVADTSNPAIFHLSPLSH
ncbi:MAG TPA: L-2-amino-thiazoline-4-carboxylic acid hydrolase [Anaerolineaceae bacterium]